MSGEGEHGQQGPSTPAVGPLAVEAALLLDVVADRLTALKPETSGAESAGPTTGSTGPEGADGTHESTAGRPLGPDGRCPECGSVPGASCTACPLCRFLAILRGERPETTAKLVDGALLIVRALRTMIPDAPAGGSAGPGDPPPPPPARRGGFERIDIG